ncbi:MAG: B12-binding domain-containing radical SAM protein [Bacteriovoracaceae bacterium]|nr:B12-binding domain-containing radical SAM protein [Bacteriovoracaceae bacterium]
MSEIILTTINARYQHSSLGLRYLFSNLGALQKRSKLIEFSLSQTNQEILESLFREKPTIIGFGVYIWNVDRVLELLKLIKVVMPNCKLIIGGPEVSYHDHQSAILQQSDFLIKGEADHSFMLLCNDILNNPHLHSDDKIQTLAPPVVDTIALPYEYYTEEDIKNRYIYVEASRGCPFECEFCLSSIDKQVRHFSSKIFLSEIQKLWDRGARHFKFIDRSFNHNLNFCYPILEYFLTLQSDDLFLHFEVIPIMLPAKLKQILTKFPVGSVQFEIGLQTLNPTVAQNIGRNLNLDTTINHLKFLKDQTNIYLHTDLIVGLPGESLESFADGFDKLLAFGPHEIQVGILKKLGGTKISRHDTTWRMHYNPLAPYNLLFNKLIDYPTMNLMERFAKFWDKLYNSGNFKNTVELIWQDSSPFWGFYSFCDWALGQKLSNYGLSLNRLAEHLFVFLTKHKSLSPTEVTKVLSLDMLAVKGRQLPPFLRSSHTKTPRPINSSLNKRQLKNKT